MADSMSISKELGPFDVLPMVRFYSTILLAFPLTNQSSQSTITKRFEAATSNLFAHYPWLAGQVERDHEWQGEDEGSRPFKISPNRVETFRNVEAQDVSTVMPSYTQLKDAKFPMSMLDANTLTSYKGAPDHYGDEDHTPVFNIRLSFIEGGLLTCFNVMHTAMDGNSLGQMIKQCATIMRGDEIPEGDIKAGNLIANQVLPSLPKGENYLELHNSMIKDPKSKPDALPKSPVKSSWAYVNFSPSQLIKLKRVASQKCLPGARVSNDDAITALLWRAITRARSLKLDMSSGTIMTRAVNLRGKLEPPLPMNFLTNCVMGYNSSLRLSALIRDMDLSDVALLLRRDLDSIDDHFVRSYITFLRSVRDKASISFMPPNPEKDYCLSSWGNWPVYGSDFGEGLGKPEYVRRPRTTSVDGLGFVMPKTEEGGLTVALGLADEAMDALRKDEELLQYAEFIG